VEKGGSQHLVDQSFLAKKRPRRNRGKHLISNNKKEEEGGSQQLIDQSFHTEQRPRRKGDQQLVSNKKVEEGGSQQKYCFIDIVITLPSTSNFSGIHRIQLMK